MESINPEDFIIQHGSKSVFNKEQRDIECIFEFEESYDVSFKNAELKNSKLRHCTFTNSILLKLILQTLR